MKKLLYLAAFMFAALFSSCASDGDTPEPDPDPQAADESWTVMFYSVGGGNLDSAQVNNMAEAFLADEYSNINMTFQFKFSKELKEKPWEGVGRFDMAEQRENAGTIKTTEKGVMDFIKRIKPTIIGNTQYDMSSAESITDFIQWSMKQHPAQHYMLVLSDHGSGYDILADNNITAKEKEEAEDEEADEARHNSILADDNLDSRQLSLTNTVKGIQDAMGEGKLDIIYTDACMMCAVENLSGYRQVANYYIGSQELTPGEGGNYTQLLNLIGKNSAETWTLAKTYVDYLVSSSHWNKEKGNHADAGVYNLQGTGFDIVLDNIKAFGLMLGKDLAGTAASDVNECVINAQVAQNISSSEYTIAWGPDEITIKEIQERYQKDPNAFIETLNEWSEDTKTAYGNATNESCYCITLADFMHKMAQRDEDEYQDIHDKYIQSLKNCAYIVNTFGKDPYEYTSMSVNVFGMTTDALAANTPSMWVKGGKICNNWSKYGVGSDNAYTASQLQDLYSNTAFEQTTGWAKNFLSKLTVNPGVFFNPSSETNTK